MSISLDFGALKALDSPTRRLARAAEMLRGQTADNQLYLSDALVRYDEGGAELIIALSSALGREARGRGSELTWILQVLRDEWGTPPVPGGVVSFVEAVNRKDLKGHPVAATELNTAMIDGSFSERFERITDYELDSRGCIRVPWDVAVQLLGNYGVHGRTRRGICGKPETSMDVCKHPTGGMKHVWYWRYAEMTREMWQALPEIEAPKKRGDR